MEEQTTLQQTETESAKLLAAIDIGSNSIRMVIGQLLPDGSIEVLERTHRTVRLGQDAFRFSQLERVTMKAAVSILREFKRRLDTYKVPHVWTVATSAVRESRNADVFADRILTATGLEVHILDGSLEGRLAVSALRDVLSSEKPDIGKHTLITEVGGGSTMLTVLENGQIEFSQSLGLGSIRLREVLGIASLPPQQAAEVVRNEIASALASVQSSLSLGEIETFFAMGADARFAASQIGKPLENPAFIAIRKKDFETLTNRIQSQSIEQIMANYDMPYTDGETVPIALLIYRELMHATKAQRIIVSSTTMRDGLLRELARQCLGRQDTTFNHEVLQSAQAIAEQYNVNIHHAKRVAACAVRLFDELQAEHRLGVRYRVLLEAATILHEIGTFVAARAYHKHTYYLIAHSQIYGLTRNENIIAAHVARYHRRSAPKPSHIEYMSLSRENRIVVNKLGALLRLAKALDISGFRELSQLSCTVADDAVILNVPGISQISLRKSLLESRSVFFEDVFGLQLKFD